MNTLVTNSKPLNNNGGIPAAEVMKYKGLATAIVKKIIASFNLHNTTCIDEKDLMQAAFLGIIDGLKRFDESQASPTTYLSIRIMGSVMDELRHADVLPRSLRARVRRAKRLLSEAERSSNRELSGSEVMDLLVAEFPKRSKDELASLIDGRIYFVSLFEAISDHNDSELIETMVGDDSFKNAELLIALPDAIDALPNQQKTLIRKHFFESKPLWKVGQEMGGITESRASQIRTQALNRIRAFFNLIPVMEADMIPKEIQIHMKKTVADALYAKAANGLLSDDVTRIALEAAKAMQTELAPKVVWGPLRQLFRKASQVEHTPLVKANGRIYATEFAPKTDARPKKGMKRGGKRLLRAAPQLNSHPDALLLAAEIMKQFGDQLRGRPGLAKDVFELLQVAAKQGEGE